MKLYKVTLLADERDELEAITHKGSHQSQKVINALILLNCDEGEFNDHRARGEDVANILRISIRKVDRVKKRFVEGAGRGFGAAAELAKLRAQGRWRGRGSPGRFKLRRTARGLRPMVAALAGRSGGGARVCGRHFPRDGQARAKKNEIKPWRKVGWVIPPEANAEFVAAMERVLDVYRRPYNADIPVVCMGETPRNSSARRAHRSRLAPASRPGKITSASDAASAM